MKTVKVTIDWTDKNYTATTADVNGVVIVTHKTYEGVVMEFNEAWDFHIEGSLEDGDKLPAWVLKGNYAFAYELSIAALLHRYEKVLTRAALSRVTGINERQLGHYAMGLRNPRPETRAKIIKGFHQLGQEFLQVG